MSKRMTDTDKWKKTWFRKLCPKCKCFWMYLLDNCDYAGIWEVDFELASVFIGVDLDDTFIRDKFKKQYKEIKGGRQWFIPDFIDFQYGTLTETNKMHRSVLNLLKKHGVCKGYLYPLDTAQEQEQDKEQVSNKDSIYIEELKKNPSYKHIDIDKELSKMDEWLDMNPTRSKTKTFITKWLDRAEPELPRGKKPKTLKRLSDRPASEVLKDLKK